VGGEPPKGDDSGGSHNPRSSLSHIVIRKCVVFLRRFWIFDFGFWIENADGGSIENRKSKIGNRKSLYS